MKTEHCQPEDVVMECTKCHSLIRATAYRTWEADLRWNYETRGICPTCQMVEINEEFELYDCD